MKKTKQTNKSGFSLLELMVVIGITASLAAVVAPKFLGYEEKAQPVQDAKNQTIINQQVETTKVMSKSNVNYLDSLLDSADTTKLYDEGDSAANGGLPSRVAGHGQDEPFIVSKEMGFYIGHNLVTNGGITHVYDLDVSNDLNTEDATDGVTVREITYNVAGTADFGGGFVPGSYGSGAFLANNFLRPDYGTDDVNPYVEAIYEHFGLDLGTDTATGDIIFVAGYGKRNSNVGADFGIQDAPSASRSESTEYGRYYLLFKVNPSSLEDPEYVGCIGPRAEVISDGLKEFTEQ